MVFLKRKEEWDEGGVHGKKDGRVRGRERGRERGRGRRKEGNYTTELT